MTMRLMSRCGRQTTARAIFALMFLLACLAGIPCRANADGGDNFNNNAKDRRKWGKADKYHHGLLTEKNRHLEYSCKGPSDDDEMYWPWKYTKFPTTSDWEARIDLYNVTKPDGVQEVNSFGLEMDSPLDSDDWLFVELYSSDFGGGGWRRGFYGELGGGGGPMQVDSGGSTGLTAGAVRMVYTAADKVVTLYYDITPSNGYDWVEFGSFGVGGSGGENGAADWNLGDEDYFTLWVYGYSSMIAVKSGQMYGDNFSETGGVR
jgi:hypothetical protein